MTLVLERPQIKKYLAHPPKDNSDIAAICRTYGFGPAKGRLAKAFSYGVTVEYHIIEWILGYDNHASISHALHEMAERCGLELTMKRKEQKAVAYWARENPGLLRLRSVIAAA